DFFLLISLFFFSSRRRHTRFKCDWSSDVCSSDLLQESIVSCPLASSSRSQVNNKQLILGDTNAHVSALSRRNAHSCVNIYLMVRSEERRVGKECRYRMGTDHDNTKKDTVIEYIYL